MTAPVTCIATLQQASRDVPAGTVQRLHHVTCHNQLGEVPVSRQPPAARARARPGLAVGWAAPGPHKPLISFMIDKLASFVHPLMGRERVEPSTGVGQGGALGAGRACGALARAEGSGELFFIVVPPQWAGLGHTWVAEGQQGS